MKENRDNLMMQDQSEKQAMIQSCFANIFSVRPKNM